MAKSLYILVVDDDNENADSLAEVFQMEDHKVRVVYSGQEAVKAYEQENFDLAFFDVMMPGKNGVDAFVEIKEKHPEAKVFFMTGYSADDLLKKAMSKGALGIFGKPVDLTKMLDTLQKVA
jgi:DNA-binding NtrC family response regulator